MQRHPGAGDRGGAGASIGLEHVAVDHDLLLAKRGEVGDGAQRAADQPLNLLRAAGLLARAGFAAGSFGGRAGQHAVFSRHPTAPLALEPWRHRLAGRRRAEHMRIAETDQARPFGVARHRALEANGAKRVGRAFGRTDDGKLSS